MFDPHKAGTVREAHTSLRDTLPSRTFEDRVLFVLNRIDECASMTDLLRVYGTLCWNLSQITGRKDIPMIHLTYSPQAASKKDSKLQADQGYLTYLDNQREELKKAILQAPCHRLDNLASFVETHGERLSHFLESLINYRKLARNFRLKSFFITLITALVFGGAGFLLSMMTEPFSSMDILMKAGGSAVIFLVIFIIWIISIKKFLFKRFHRKKLKNLDDLTPLQNQTRKDSWEAIRDIVYVHLKDSNGRYSIREVRQEHSAVLEVYEKGTKEIREALKELSNLSPDEINLTSSKFDHRPNLEDWYNPQDSEI